MNKIISIVLIIVIAISSVAFAANDKKHYENIIDKINMEIFNLSLLIDDVRKKMERNPISEHIELKVSGIRSRLIDLVNNIRRYAEECE